MVECLHAGLRGSKLKGTSFFSTCGSDDSTRIDSIDLSLNVWEIYFPVFYILLEEVYCLPWTCGKANEVCDHCVDCCKML